jgi:hypothetical protein
MHRDEPSNGLNLVGLRATEADCERLTAWRSARLHRFGKTVALEEEERL